MNFLASNGTNHFTTIERVNVKNLLALCHSKKLQEWDSKNFPKDDKNNDEEIQRDGEFIRHHINSLKNYAEIAIPNNGNVEITYCYDEFGRLKNINPYGKSYSFTNMKKEIRNLLADGKYIDLDFYNMHYTIFHNISVKLGLETKYIRSVAIDRESVGWGIIRDNKDTMTDPESKQLLYEMSKECDPIMKNIFIRLLYGANIENIKQEFKIEQESFLDNLSKEIRKNSASIVKEGIYKKEAEYILKKKQRENDTSNILGSQIASILQTKERELLFTLIRIIIEDKFEVGACIHDGLHILKNDYLKNNLHFKMTEWEHSINLFLDRNNEIPYKLTSKEMKTDNTFLIPDDERMKYLYQKNILENSYGLARLQNTGEYICFERQKKDDKDKQIPIRFFSGNTELIEFFRNKCLIGGKSAIHKWINDPDMKEYEKMEFNPRLKLKGEENSNIYNTFTGFRIDDYKFNNLPKTQEERKKLIQPLLDFIRLISGNVDSQYTSIMNFISHLFKKPYKKVKFCPVFKGRTHGAGKNTFLLLIKAIIGERYVFSTPNIKVLFDRFNSARCDKLFICINEANFQDSNKFLGILKDGITEDSFILERKGKDPVEVPSFENYMITSNDFLPIQIEEGNRRLFLIKLDNLGITPEEKEKLFNTIYNDFLPNDKMLRVFYEYMLEWFNVNDVDNYNFEQNIETAESKILKQTDPMDDWIIKYIIQEHMQKADFVKSTNIISKSPTELKDAYISYCKTNSYKYDSVNSMWVSKHLMSRFDKFITKSNSKGRLSNLYDIHIDAFLSYFNINIDEVDDLIIN